MPAVAWQKEGPAASRPTTPVEDGAAAFAAMADQWPAFWAGKGPRPVPRCRWTGREDQNAWMASFERAMAEARRHWYDALPREEWLKLIQAEWR